MQSAYFKHLKLLASLIYLNAAPAFGVYSPSEILVIPWGEDSNQLEIMEPYRAYNEGPEPDTIGYLAAEGGPNKCFVDRQENFYFMSYEIGYLKGFDNSGKVIVDYSEGKTEFSDDLFKGMFINFYVDSLGRIYCGGDEIFKPFVAVVDRNNNILDKLNPFGIESGIGCTLLGWGSDDVLTFLSFERGMYTYINGQFTVGGSSGWRARDGYYYMSKRANSSSFYIFRYTNPDTAGHFDANDTLIINFEFNNLEAGGLYMLDDSLNFYIDYKDSSGVHDGIRVYDHTLKLIDEIQYLPRQENRYLWDTPYPFIRNDGNIYEFHCRDDGLHVFRWSKQ